jgi:hypothetical protein
LERRRLRSTLSTLLEVSGLSQNDVWETFGIKNYRFHEEELIEKIKEYLGYERKIDPVSEVE